MDRELKGKIFNKDIEIIENTNNFKEAFELIEQENNALRNHDRIYKQTGTDTETGYGYLSDIVKVW